MINLNIAQQRLINQNIVGNLFERPDEMVRCYSSTRLSRCTMGYRTPHEECLRNLSSKP